MENKAKFESKWVKWLHVLMMILCVVILIAGLILGYGAADSYMFFDGGLFLVITIATVLIDVIYFVIAKVTCEFLNNVHIIKNEICKITNKNSTEEN